MIVAVTGTKGKTTIVSMVNHCLSEIGATTSSICTLGLYKGKERRTKKSPLKVYEEFFSREMHTDFQCIEITSHLLQMGVIPENIAAATVLTGIELGEHEEIHPRFKDYVSAKRKIYNIRKSGCKTIVCADSPHFEELTHATSDLITYGFRQGSDLEIKVKEQTSQKAVIKFSMSGESIELTSRVLGKHNYRNLAASYLSLTEIGIESRTAAEKLSTFPGALGRFERFIVGSSNQKKTVIIDYAHTPGSLRDTLSLIQEIYPSKRVCTVFGCGGNKSVTKRPLMGMEATSRSDVVIVTNDNPREESPEKIIDDILSGALNSCIVEMDRERAISKSLETGCEIILLAGKGAEEEYKIDNRIYVNRSDKRLLERVCREKNFELAKYV